MRLAVRRAALLALLALHGCDVTVKTGDGPPLGTFTCTALKDNVCVEPTDRFPSTVDVVHMHFHTKDVPKNGDVYIIRWIAEDVGQTAAPNTLIATLEEKVSDSNVAVTSYRVNSHLTKPTKGWPVGKYRVEVERAGVIETTARFTIQP